MTQTQPIILHDGGRSAAGYKGSARDCVCRAISIATEMPYEHVYQLVAEACANAGKSRSARNGVPKKVTRKLLLSLGWKWIPTMRIGQGCRVHLRPDELPKGRIIAQVSRHIVAVIDGQIFDSHDPTRNGTRCVYGYYSHD